jgi:hypothetical protein
LDGPAAGKRVDPSGVKKAETGNRIGGKPGVAVGGGIAFKGQNGTGGRPVKRAVGGMADKGSQLLDSLSRIEGVYGVFFP